MTELDNFYLDLHYAKLKWMAFQSGYIQPLWSVDIQNQINALSNLAVVKTNALTKSTMINRKFIFTLYVFIFSINFLNAQVITMKDLYGKRNVSNWIVLNTTAQTNDEKKDFEKQKKKCLKSNFIIDSVTIKNNSNVCEFVLCSRSFDSTTKINELPIIEDNENTKRYPGNEIVESNFVGNTFIRLLDKNYNKNKIAMVKTNVNISHYGDPLSGNDATGNVINVHSNTDVPGPNQHGNAKYNKELDFTLQILEGGQGNVKGQLKEKYKEWDKTRNQGLKSKVD